MKTNHFGGHRVESLEPRRLLSSDTGGATSLRIGNTLFFVATDADHGAELWKSNPDGSSKQLVKDISPGTYDSDPNWFTNFDGKFYFAAGEKYFGEKRNIWTSDGTEAGTTRITNLPTDDYDTGPHELMVANHHLFFLSTRDDILWATDASGAGQAKLFDLNPNWESIYYWEPAAAKLLVRNNLLYFTAASNEPYTEERWQSDGTVAGTTPSTIFGTITSDRVLQIFGTHGDDVINLTANGSRTTLTSTNGPAQTFRNRNFDSIYLGTGIGPDTVNITEKVHAPATIYANGHVHAGAGDDLIKGDGTLLGGGGDDRIEAGYRSTAGGGDGNDTLVATYDDVLLSGDAGNDLLLPNFGDDITIDGGAGARDTIQFPGDYYGASVSGGGGHFTTQSSYSSDDVDYSNVERLIASQANDNITLSDTDSIRFVDGLDGDDTITGGAQNETLVGGSGNDCLNGNGGADLIVGDSGADSIAGGGGTDTLVAGFESSDFITSDAQDVVDRSFARIVDGALHVVGTTGDDSIQIQPQGKRNLRVSVNGSTKDFSAGLLDRIRVGGGDGDDGIGIDPSIKIGATLTGDNGDDTIAPGGGEETVEGNDGVDTLDYSQRTDALRHDGGGSGFRTSSGDWDHDFQFERLLCGSGDDVIRTFNYGGYPNSYYDTIYYIDGGPGDDSLQYYSLTNGGDGIDPIVHGGDGNDTIGVDQQGNEFKYIGNNVLHYYGDAGDDEFYVFRSFAHRDFNGGPGKDTLNYGPFSTAGSFRITLDDVADDGPYGEDNVHSDMEEIWGSPWGDTMIGTDKAETLHGSGYHDSLVGNGGDDLLIGGGTLEGGDGNDTLQGSEYNNTNDTMLGGNGNDCLAGMAGNDSLDGGPGNDTLLGGDGDDTLNGGPGQDSINGGSGMNTIIDDIIAGPLTFGELLDQLGRSRG